MNADDELIEQHHRATERENMLQTQIVARGISDPLVLDAIRSIPRELFVPAEHVKSAYDDRALPVGPDQTISQPYIVAYMTAHCRIGAGDSVLEVGTGTGFQTAVLAKLAMRVYTVERDAALSDKAQERLNRLGILNTEYLIGDGSLGWADRSPFARIIVTAGCPRIPRPLLDQLSPDGLMLVPVGDKQRQTLMLVRRRSGGFTEQPMLPCRFVRLEGAEAW